MAKLTAELYLLVNQSIVLLLPLFRSTNVKMGNFGLKSKHLKVRLRPFVCVSVCKGKVHKKEKKLEKLVQGGH